MINCKRCGYEGIYTGKICPRCHNPIILKKEEVDSLIEELETIKESADKEALCEFYKILADYGHTESEKEYAKLLERGGGSVTRDIDAAADYFYRAAKKCDPEGAYRYSRLVSRMNEEAGTFWLALAAYLGHKEAYLPASEAYTKFKNHEAANHYCYLAAQSDNVDAIVRLANKYYNGEGVDPSAAKAKWYMEKLTFPPFYAIKLAYKLRGVRSEEAPSLTMHDKRSLARELLGGARSLGEPEAELLLLTELADMGDSDAMYSLAEKLYREGGVENAEEIIRILTRAAASGNAQAYMKLGRIYVEGAIQKQNIKLALGYFEAAARGGIAEAYEMMGDVFHAKSNPERNVAYACELYEKAARGGVKSAEAKAEGIKEARQDYFCRADALEDSDPKAAFRFFAIATGMGYLPATLRLARCYALGIGTKISRPDAHYWYKNAADSGYEDAYFPLAICYSRGIGTAFNFELAMKYLALADKAGEARAEKEARRLASNKRKCGLRKIYSTAMRLVYQKKFEAAREYLELASRLGNPRATYTLGCLYEFGRGVECDKNRAYALYDAAAKASFSDPRSRYKLTVLKMLKRN